MIPAQNPNGAMEALLNCLKETDETKINKKQKISNQVLDNMVQNAQESCNIAGKAIEMKIREHPDVFNRPSFQRLCKLQHEQFRVLDEMISIRDTSKVPPRFEEIPALDLGVIDLDQKPVEECSSSLPLLQSSHQSQTALFSSSSFLSNCRKSKLPRLKTDFQKNHRLRGGQDTPVLTSKRKCRDSDEISGSINGNEFSFVLHKDYGAYSIDKRNQPMPFKVFPTQTTVLPPSCVDANNNVKTTLANTKSYRLSLGKSPNTGGVDVELRRAEEDMENLIVEYANANTQYVENNQEDSKENKTENGKKGKGKGTKKDKKKKK